MELKTFFTENPVVALGFSGGVDSSYLLYAALYYGAKVKAYFVKTAFQPDFELQDAYRMAKQLNTEITVIEKDILAYSQVIANPIDRCYHCKRIIFGRLVKQAKEDGIPVIIDGTNASDDSDDRPGMRALTELSIRSPLRECGLTKDEIRARSKETGLFTWNKPAYACLATRVPTGRQITGELLDKVGAAEDVLFSMGFSDFRVRLLDDAAKLQFPAAQMEAVLIQRQKILQAIKPFFSTILLDLEGRRDKEQKL